MAVLIPIITQYAGKGVERAVKEFQSLNSVTDKASFALRKALIPGAIAAAGAAYGLGKALFSASKAAAEDQKSQALLARQLQATTGATAAQITAVEDFITATQNASGVTDDQLRPALASLVRATGDASKAQTQLGLALDIAAGTGKDVESVSIALAKAYNGNFAALTKLGVPLDENITKTKNYAAVQEALDKQFGGASKTAANTFQGQLQRLAVGWGEIQEQLGYLVLPLLERFTRFVNDAVVPGLQEFVRQLSGGAGVKDAMAGAVKAMGTFGPTMIEGARQATNALLEFVRTAAITYEAIKALSTAARFFKGDIRGAVVGFAQVVSAAAVARFTRGLQADTNKFFDDLTARANDFTLSVAPIPDRLDRLAGSLTKIKEAVDQPDPFGENKLGGAAKTANTLQKRLEEAAKTLREDMAEALESAQEQLETAQQAFDDFGKSVGDAIKEAVDFGAAFEESAEEGGGTFFDELNKQADRAQEFGALVEQLLQQGISKDALDQVLAAGVESGSEIAKQLLAAADGVLRANKLVEATQAIADRIGKAAAEKFYAAGVANGQQYLRGIMEAIAEAERRIAGAKRPADIKGAGAAFSDTMSKLNTAPASSGTSGPVTVNVQTLDPRTAGDYVVDALREYQQRAGYIGVNAVAL